MKNNTYDAEVNMQKISGNTHSFIVSWFAFLDRYRLFFGFFPLVLCVMLAGGIPYVKENSDGRIFFDPASPERQTLLSMEQNFTETNSLLFVVSVDEKDVFEPEVLEVLLYLTDKAWQLPFVTRVNSLTNYQRISSAEDDVMIESLITAEMLGERDTLIAVRNYALSERDLLGQIISKDGKTTALALNIAAPRGDGAALQEIMGEVEKLRQELAHEHPELSFYVTGDTPLDVAFSEAYAHDLQVIFPVFIAMVFAVCFYFFRSLRLSAIILLLMCLAVAATMGAAGYLGIELTAGTSGVPIILITISLADFIHILSSVRLNIKAGRDGPQSIYEAIQSNFLPITLTSFTTFIGFISLNFNDAPPFQDMGNLVALGIGICFLLTFTLFPAILLGLNLNRIFARKSHGLLKYTRYTEKFSTFVLDKRRPITGVLCGIAVVVCSGISQIELDDDWVKYFDESNRFRQDTEFVAGHLTGVDTIEYVVFSDAEGGISDKDFLLKLDQFVQWAYAQPEITHVSSIASIFKKMNEHMNGGRAAYMKIAEDSELNAQYLLMYEMSLPVGLDINDRIDIAKEVTRVTLTGRDMTSAQMRKLDGKVSNKLQTMGLLKPENTGTGIPLLFANLSEKNIQSMLTGIGFAIGLVSIIITIVFRSIKLGVISFVVNILPILMGFGLWGWFYQYVGLSLTVVAAIAFGIVVDDSIHFITKYKTSLDERGSTPQRAMNDTFSEVGGALLMTTFILVLGFAVLSLSSFQPTWALGLISAGMISIALVYDFLLLPAILVMFPSKKDKSF